MTEATARKDEDRINPARPESWRWQDVIDEHQAADELPAESETNKDTPPTGQTEQNRTYIAIDGISPSQLDDTDRELLEKRTTDLLLTSGYPIEDVRVITDAHVFEVEQTND